jgi:hypothetical protein
MVHDTRDYSVFELTFRKVDLFPSSGEGLGDTYSVEVVRKG